MTTDMSGGPGAFRRLMNKVATWSDALNYSGIDYTLDRIAFVERELAEIKDRMRQFEASRHEPPDVPPMRRPADVRGFIGSPGIVPQAIYWVVVVGFAGAIVALLVFMRHMNAIWRPGYGHLL